MFLNNFLLHFLSHGFWRFGYADLSDSIQILILVSININTKTIQLTYIPRFINNTENVLFKLSFSEHPLQKPES